MANGITSALTTANQPQVMPMVPRTGLAGSEEALISAGQEFGPFAQAGAGAQTLQAALTGAAGPAAQAEAFRTFQESPGQQFLREQGEQAVLRNAAAIGGTGGGNVRRALTRFGQGLASQGLQQQIQNLSDIANRGLTATTGRGTIARDIASGRLQTGRDIAEATRGTTSALADLTERQGTQLAGATETGGINLANLLQGAGSAQATDLTNLAQILANISTQQGTASTQLPSPAQFIESGGILPQIGQLASGVGTAVRAFNPTR